MSTFNKNTITKVIYHYPCCDGFGAAFVVWLYCRKNNLPLPTFIGANHGDVHPNVAGDNVLILDFSYPLKTIQEMKEKANSILIIDHHAMAEKDLAAFDANCKIFGKNSGAVLAWKFFFGEEPVPLLLLYIEDRDIWAKKMPNGEAFSTWLFTQNFEFEIYNQLYSDPNAIERAIEKGIIYLEKDKYDIKRAAERIKPKFVCMMNKDKEEYFIIGHLCSTTLQSDIGNAGFNIFPYLDATAIYRPNDGENRTTFSLRSTDYHADVSVICKTHLGGGGHRNASGGSIAAITNSISSKTYDNGDTYRLLTQNIKFDEEAASVIVNAAHHKKAIAKYLLQQNNGKHNTAMNIWAIKQAESMFEVDWNAKSEFVAAYQNNLRNAPKFNCAIIWFSKGESLSAIYYFDDISLAKSKKYSFNEEQMNDIETTKMCIGDFKLQ